MSTATLTSPAGLHQCAHQPACPSADRLDREAARVVSGHPEQGWSLLCNGVVLFDDMGELLPDGRSVPAHHPTARHRSTAALATVG